MKTTSKLDLQEFTELPIQTIMVADRQLPDILVKTPHKGRVNLSLTSTHIPFIFGSTTEIQKHLPQLVKELTILEEESKSFLLNEWRNKQSNY